MEEKFQDSIGKKSRPKTLNRKPFRIFVVDLEKIELKSSKTVSSISKNPRKIP
jgi:hypothetical protein